jgi:hypothetical protein
MTKIGQLLKSRKFWAAVVGLAFVLLGERAGIPLDQLVAGVAVVVSYILGTALEDGLRARAR